jgi:small GTP-binding protein
LIQKKICMVGAFGVGKTSLVARFVRSIFSDKYLTTLGVKIDKKALNVDGEEMTLMLWDLAGKDAFTEVKATQLRGSSGYILVADGCRASTLEAAIDLQSRAEAELGKVPFTCVVNKADLRESWEVDAAALDRLSTRGWPLLLTSAKSGEGVEELFQGLAARLLEEKGNENHG